jgi:hypothetical protein
MQSKFMQCGFRLTRDLYFALHRLQQIFANSKLTIAVVLITQLFASCFVFIYHPCQYLYSIVLPV